MVKKTHSHTQKVIRIELKISLNPNSTNVISRTWIGLCGMPSKSVSQSVSVPAYCSCKWVSEEIDGWWPVQYTLNAEYINQNIYVNFSSEHSHAWTWANVPAPDSRRVCMCVRIAYAGCSMNSIWNLLFHRIHLRVLCALDCSLLPYCKRINNNIAQFRSFDFIYVYIFWCVCVFFVVAVAASSSNCCFSDEVIWIHVHMYIVHGMGAHTIQYIDNNFICSNITNFYDPKHIFQSFNHTKGAHTHVKSSHRPYSLIRHTTFMFC